MTGDATSLSQEPKPTRTAANSVPDDSEVCPVIQQARAGSAAARNELLASVRSYLLLIADQELDPQLQARIGPSDLVQSALLLAEQNLDRFRGDSRAQLLAWLREILKNEMTTVWRTHLGTAKRDARRDVRPSSQCPAVAPVTDPAPTPGTTASLNEEASALRNALSRLPADQRQAVLLRNWERLSFDDMGSRLNRSADAAKKLWSRAVLRLQEELKRESVEP